MFASKSPEGWNHDPEPVLYPDGVRTDGCGWLPLPNDGIRLAPRPEFDHVQHNEPNPILVAARNAHRDCHLDAFIEGFLSNSPLENEHPGVIHARRVLTRLAQIGD